MPTFIDWVNAQNDISSTALTVRAQAQPTNDNGRLRWDRVMPRRNIPSVDLRELRGITIRPVAERREWDARGRVITFETPNFADMTIVPIEARHELSELEIQRIMERVGGDQARFRTQAVIDMPDRVREMVNAVYRRVELDVFSAWANGSITVRNPEDYTTYIASYQFDSGRYQSAATAWDDPGVNAFNEFLAWWRDARSTMGAVAGAMLREASMYNIISDAPNLAANINGPQGIEPTIAQVEDRIRQLTGGPFTFVPNEDTVKPYSGPGFAQVTTNVWPAGKIAAIPAGQPVGYLGTAPVVRGMELANATPAARIDQNGVTVYHIPVGDGLKQIRTETQLNAAPVPDEQSMFVMDDGL